MAKGIVIPHDAGALLHTAQFSALNDYQDAVGGWIEPIQIQSPHICIIANEEGKVHGLQLNQRATIMLWLLAQELQGLDALVGDVVLIGTRGPEQVEIPEPFRKLLLETDRYKCEVQTDKRPDHWYGSGMRFSSYFRAAADVLNFKSRSSDIEKVRVVAA